MALQRLHGTGEIYGADLAAAVCRNGTAEAPWDLLTQMIAFRCYWARLSC